MKNNIQHSAEKFNQEHRKKNSWQKVVSVLAAFAVFCTTYAMILPAITMDNSLVCGMDEHVHTDECYMTVEVPVTPEIETTEAAITFTSGSAINAEPEVRTERVLICSLEEHTHTSECYDAAPAEVSPYVCGLAEHTHTEECYFEDGITLKCTMAEHVHSEECMIQAEAEIILSEHEIESAPAEDGAVAVISGMLPEDAAATIEAVSLSMEQLIDYFGARRAAVMKSYVAYDIKIWSDGEEWQPDETVSVSVQHPDIAVEEGENFAVAHVDSETNEISEVEAELTEEGEVLFAADGFSVYIIYTFTVDFHYGDSVYSITGYDEINLADLFVELGIDIDVDEIEDVSFSNPEFLAIVHDEDGWWLVSLEPFDTDETLTLTFRDGSVFELLVTDAQETTWQKVTSIDDADSNYLIVYSEKTYRGTTNHVLTYSGNGYSSSVSFDKDGDFYTTDDVTESMMFKFGSKIGTSGKTSIQSVKESGKYLRISKNSVFGDSRNLTVTYSNGYWRIKDNDGYFLRYYDGFGRSIDKKEDSYYADLRNMTVYKQVEKQVPVVSGDDITYDKTSHKFTVQVYTVQVDASGNRIGEPKELRTIELSGDSYNGRILTYNLFKNANLGDNYYYYDAYLGNADGPDTNPNGNHVTSLWRSSGSGNYSLKYSSSSSASTIYVNSSNYTDKQDCGLYIEYYKGESSAAFDESKVPDHFKRIDAFRDGTKNPDTDLDDSSADMTDFYRLYLDVGPETAYEAVDLVIVVDRSNSMKNSFGNTSRENAVAKVLNGQVNQITSAGLISKFLSLNEENRVSVTSFGKEKYDILGWTNRAEWAARGNAINVGHRYEGTNYVAGLNGAKALFETSDGDHKKVMIFISDGQPSHYAETFSGSIKGDGSSDDINDQTDYYSKTAFTTFNLLVPGVATFALGVGEDFSNTNVLNFYASNSKTVLLNNYDALIEEIDKMMTRGVGHYSNMKVTDTLSDYVNFASDLDLLIQKVPEDKSESVKTLYTGNFNNGNLSGTLTTDGRKYIKQGGVSISGKTITVDFLDAYEEEGGYTYRISFNVKTEQYAYDTYAANVVSGNDGYNGVTGDSLTDYAGNNTSEGEGGFRSNSSAVLEYSQAVGSTSSTEIKTTQYNHPVVQVATDDLTVEKMWSDGNNNHTDDSVTVKLSMMYQASGESQETKHLIDTVTIDKDDDWTYTFTDLPKKVDGNHYTFVVEETAVDGYTTTYSTEGGSVVGGGTVVITNTYIPPTVQLTITKDLAGSTDSATEFRFVASLDSGDFIPNPAPGNSYTINSENHSAEFTLKDDQSITLILPEGSSVTIEELTSAGYYVKFEQTIPNTNPPSVGNVYTFGSDSFTAERTGAVTVHNIPGAVLPSTGGPGIPIVYSSAAAMMAGVLTYGCTTRRKKERRRK